MTNSDPQLHQTTLPQKVTRRRVLAMAGAAAAALIIPGCGGDRGYVRGVRYRVRSGDTLSGIARATGLELRQILTANPQLSSSQLRVGQELLLPGLTKFPAPPAATPPASPVAARLNILPRSTWGAKPLKPNHDPMNGIRRITLHHTSEHPGMTGIGDREVIAKIANYHRDVKQWADIGYHYLIGRDGTIYEGRSLIAQGAHSGGDNNKHNLGISLIGDFTYQRPSGQQARVTAQFLRQQMQTYRVPMQYLYGHRDLKNTLCPGDQGYRWLQDFRQGRV